MGEQYIPLLKDGIAYEALREASYSYPKRRIALGQSLSAGYPTSQNSNWPSVRKDR